MFFELLCTLQTLEVTAYFLVFFTFTIVDDFTKEDGLQAALRAVTTAAPGEYIHLWASLPCTAGSPWQHMNKKYPRALKKIEENLDIFIKLIGNFEKVAKKVVEQGGDVSVEWPTECALWKHELTQKLVNDLSMNKVNMRRCAPGLTSAKDNTLIKKPWTVASTSLAIVDTLSNFQCPGKEMHPVHSPCAGAETKRTELYTPDMADAIHFAIQEEALSQRATAAMASVPKVRGECNDAEDEVIGRLDPTGHREKLGPEGLWCKMTTKTLAPGDPLARSPPTIKAIMREFMDLREHNVWDESNPVEASEMAPVDSKTRTHNRRVGSARRRAESGARRRWAKQGADISVALEANRPSGPPAHCK